MAKKEPPFIGVWAELIEMFTAPMLANMLGCSEEDLNAMAKNALTISPEIADKARDLCQLHGIRPSLYQYKHWLRHNNVVIASVPEGWQVWSLASGSGWAKHSRWFGGLEEIKLAVPELLDKARTQGWGW